METDRWNNNECLNNRPFLCRGTCPDTSAPVGDGETPTPSISDTSNENPVVKPNTATETVVVVLIFSTLTVAIVALVILRKKQSRLASLQKLGFVGSL